MKKILIILLTLTSISSAQTLYSGPMAAVLMKHDLGIFMSSRPESTQVNLFKAESDFEIHKVAVQYPVVGKINLLLKGPRGFMSSAGRTYRALMIVSGFFTGEQSVHLIGDLKDKILVGFEYPFGAEDFLKDPLNILQFMRKTPGQIALALKWVSQQNWLRPGGLSVMGVSLGGIFLPASLHLSQSVGVRLERTIYVCTGVDLRLILAENLKSYVAEPFLIPLVESLIVPTQLMDPKLHLPYLKGPSLVIQTSMDTVIPPSSRQGLIDLLPEPKREFVIPGPHINADQVEIIKRVQEIVLSSFPQESLSK